MHKATKDEEQEIYKRIYHLSTCMVGDYHDACDLTQEVFVELEKGREKWDKARSKWAWASGVFRRQLKRFWRLKRKSRKVSGEILGEAKIATPEDLAIHREQLDKATKVIKELNKDIAQALLLFTIEQMSIKDIAKLQNVPIGTVKWRIFEARRCIAARLEK